ncbi:hypothetical protein [Mangrovicoccus sp. HB161399]|uniref:hypothetical protein n=1 Tax=Mangrovicoccus sp. HB161399 TaxID=2720392 RepID=UPI001553BEEE|nr:hypothetical protein [Mangrovicoccus sp. HB161399]
MRPNLALSLSTEEVVLYVSIDDGWQRLGRVSIAGRDLGLQMAVLRRIAESFSETEGLDTLLCVPADQVLWKRLGNDGVGGNPAQVAAHIRRALEGATPFEVSRLRADWRRSGAGIDIAVIALETMEEVEEFCSAHGFHPVGIAALPEPSCHFQGTAWFGLAGAPTAPDGRDTVAAPHPGNIVTLDSSLPVAHAQQEAGEEDGGLSPAQRAARTTAAIDAPRQAPPRPGRGSRAAGLLLPGLLVGGLCAALAAAAFYLPGGGMPDAELAALTAPAQPLPEYGAPEMPDGTLAEADPGGFEGAESYGEEAMLFDEAAAGADAAAEPAPAAAEGDAPDLSGGFVSVDPASISRLGGWSSDDLAQPGVDIVAQVDALALNQVPPDPARILPLAMTPPPRPDQDRSQTDAAGFVRPSDGGNLAPGGYLVKTGLPAAAPGPRPAPDPEAETVTRLADADAAAPGAHPRKRPADMAERYERQQLGGRTVSELARLRPAQRSPQAAMVAVALFAERSPPPPMLPALTAEPGTARPAPRPGDLQSRSHAAQVASAQSAAAAAAKASTAAVLTRPAAKAEAPPKATPAAVRAPDTTPQEAPGNVARRATDGNEMNLRRVNLLGTFGKPGDLRALVRMPNGDVVNVSVGDRLDGGKVVAIGQGELRYQKKGRNEILSMPSG